MGERRSYRSTGLIVDVNPTDSQQNGFTLTPTRKSNRPSASLPADRIILDLAAVSEGSSLEADGFIQIDARDRLLRLLLETKPTRPDRPAGRPEMLNVQPGRSHDAIFVNARRGEGKTTFLTSILEDLERPGGTYPGLYSLGIIDPTLIETKQHIVIVVIDRLKAAIDYAFQTKVPGAGDRYERFKQSLQKLAPGLAMLDGIGGKDFYGEDWLDADFVLSQGLTDARAASAFELELQKCISIARDCLEVDKFILAIDDVDTWFERGWPVLEAVRKYLTSPHLQIVLSGDLDLYNLLVRSKQWSQFGKDFLYAEHRLDKAENAAVRLTRIAAKVDELQDQYLIKVMRPERRIDLQPLTNFKGRLNVRVSTEHELTIEAFADLYCRRVLATKSYQATEAILDLLLRLPVRSALQIMISAVDVVRPEDDNEVGASERRRAIDGLRYVAWTDLMQLGLSPEETRSLSPRMLTPLLARWFTGAKQWRSLPRFHPEAAETRFDLPALFGAAFVTDVFRQEPARMIDYLLRISTVRELVDAGTLARNDHDPTRITLEALLDHLGVSKMEDSLQTVSRYAAWEISNGRNVRPGIYFSMASVPVDRVRERVVAAWDLYGVNETGEKMVTDLHDLALDDIHALPVALRRFHSTLREGLWDYPTKGLGAFDGSFVNSIAGLKSRISPNAVGIVGLPAFRVLSGQAKNQGGYSFLRLIAAIGELIGLPSAGTDRDALKRSVQELLAQATLERSYPTPNAEISDDDDDPGPEASDDDVPQNSSDNKGLNADATVEALVEWIECWRNRIPATPPLILSRIWSRFTYAHESIRRQMRHKDSRYLGVLMHRSAIAFLHSVLVETLRGANQIISSNAYNNPITAPEPFVALLAEVYGNEAKIDRNHAQLFEAIFTCPLWAFFLPRHSDFEWRRLSEANEFIIGVYDARRSANELTLSETFSQVAYAPAGQGGVQMVFDGLYDLLNTVQLQGNPRKKPARPARSRATTE